MLLLLIITTTDVVNKMNHQIIFINYEYNFRIITIIIIRGPIKEPYQQCNGNRECKGEQNDGHSQIMIKNFEINYHGSYYYYYK